MKKYIYIVYKTSNLINGKIYVGVHKTLDLYSDCYYGSGRYVLSSIDKYGKINFEREVLFLYHSEEVAYRREKYIVDKEFLEREDTMNLTLGGKGGWSHCHTKEIRNKINDTNLSVYGNKCNNLHSTLSISNKWRSLENKYGSRTNHMLTKSCIIKSKETKKLNGSDRMNQCRSKEAIDKAKITRSKLGLDSTDRLRSKECKLKSKNTKRSKCFTKENSQLCKLISSSNEQELVGSVIDITSYLYGDRYAVSLSKRTLDKLKSGDKFIRGNWKGYSIISHP